MVDKGTVRTPDVLLVDTSSCEESTKWSDKLKGSSYSDPEGVSEIKRAKARKETVKLREGYIEKSKFDTYEGMSLSFMEQYRKLIKDHDKWAENVSNEKAIRKAAQFEKNGEIKVHDDLSKLAI